MWDNKRCIDVVNEVWTKALNAKQYDVLDGIFADDYTFNGNHQTGAQVKEWIEGFEKAFDGTVHFVIFDLFGGDNKVCIRWVLHVNDDGTPMQGPGTNVVTFDDNYKVLSNWQNGVLSTADLKPSTS